MLNLELQQLAKSNSISVRQIAPSRFAIWNSSAKRIINKRYYATRAEAEAALQDYLKLNR